MITWTQLTSSFRFWLSHGSCIETESQWIEFFFYFIYHFPCFVMKQKEWMKTLMLLVDQWFYKISWFVLGCVIKLSIIRLIESHSRSQSSWNETCYYHISNQYLYDWKSSIDWSVSLVPVGFSMQINCINLFYDDPWTTISQYCRSSWTLSGATKWFSGPRTENG